nr:peptidoglycan-binding protein [Leptospiraceae bacterium]
TDKDKQKVGMRTADESQGKTTASLPETPPGSKPGQCWIPVVSAATYKEISESVEKKAPSERVELIPARYEIISEKILVKEASTSIETIPAVYETVEEKVLIRPASKKVEQIPAVYETIEEKVIDKEGYTEWKKDTSTGIKCLVEVPPTYKMITKEVVKIPATSKETEVPAEYATVVRQVLKTPASSQTIEIPAEYRTVQVQKLVEPAKEIKIPISAEYQTVTKRVIDQPEKAEWREILCENNTTRERMTEIQKALKAAGNDPGTTDGVADAGTFKALNDYQKAKSLPVDDGKHINMATVRSLGVMK